MPALAQSAIAMDERQKRQRSRNRALLIVLVGLVAMLYVLAMVRVGGPHNAAPTSFTPSTRE
ncbi:MAG TPA: hypothetical protein VIJ42_06675 [Stellaceae bacterium]